MTLADKFSLKNKVVVISGGAGFLGIKHGETIAESGGIPVIWDIAENTEEAAKQIFDKFGIETLGIKVDITDSKQVESALESTLSHFKKVDILINNAANNPKVEDNDQNWHRVESFSPLQWESDIAVGLTGVFLCSKTVGSYMAEQKSGVILNIASDLSLISPDQRLYKNPELPESSQPVKPITYSVIKHGLIGLTKYLATYWCDQNIRVNAISPGGVYNGQPEEFVKKISKLIPLGRMAKEDEYKAAVLFLVSDASSYMTGANLVMDGGRSVW